MKINEKYTLNSESFGTCCSYVMQDDILFGYFSVKEALIFAGKLKLNISE